MEGLLPYECLVAIALQMYPRYICDFALVCRACGPLSKDENLFHALYLKEFPDNPNLQLEYGWTWKEYFGILFNTKRQMITDMHNLLDLEYDFKPRTYVKPNYVGELYRTYAIPLEGDEDYDEPLVFDCYLGSTLCGDSMYSWDSTTNEIEFAPDMVIEGASLVRVHHMNVAHQNYLIQESRRDSWR
jgi:hypothetical protein